MATPRRRLGEILLEAGVMTEAALARARRSPKRMGEALIAMRAVPGGERVRASGRLDGER